MTAPRTADDGTSHVSYDTPFWIAETSDGGCLGNGKLLDYPRSSVSARYVDGCENAETLRKRSLPHLIEPSDSSTMSYVFSA